MDELRDGLWIGSRADAATTPLREYGITHVLTVCQDGVADNLPATIGATQFPLADGVEQGHVPGDASYTTFAGAADCLEVWLVAGRTVLVHCHRGRSRSVAVCAAAIANLYSVDIEQVREDIEAIRETDISPHVWDHARRYVGADV